ncbi:AcrR family transcriptional regulator [Kibdelosporangium banguiense]|uniref:AcrR family transcriptional regulator n=1 Tax=Kibdelosporangium banguiense TaxID=1365924 RepID=A0ABS4TML7_9PSEU|nr:TetR family transcriptional regulator [Kibdelosporangium banguiense]MBP2325239.1 AcrR family transcriptional regulator [Kibdelosporangium banguiense]
MAHVPAEQRRQQLVAAAFRVVAREGVAAASTRRIAHEAKVPPAVVHYCFHSVEELIDALMAAVFADVAEAAAVALRASGAVEHSLRTALRRLWGSYRDDPAGHQAVVELVAHALRRPAATMIVREHQCVLGTLAEQFLADLAVRNKTTWRSPTRVLSRFLISTVDGVLLNWLIDRDDAETEAALEWLAITLAAEAV